MRLSQKKTASQIYVYYQGSYTQEIPDKNTNVNNFLPSGYKTQILVSDLCF